MRVYYKEQADSNVKCYELGGGGQSDDEEEGALMVFTFLLFRFNCNETWYCIK